MSGCESDSLIGIHALFNPSTVALIGASDEKGKIGYVFMRNLIERFEGKVYPIHPSKEEIQGIKAYKSVLDVPEGIDLAVILIPPKIVPSVVSECGKKGVKAVVVITAGFKEIGGEGAKLERELVEIGKNTGVRIVGPNCFGVMNLNIGLNASMALGTPEEGGDIAFITQSGAYGMALYSFAVDAGMKFGKMLSLGNKADVDEVDALEYLKDDPETKVILLFLESVQRGRRFFELTKEISKQKPIIATKSGRTLGSARAAASHTGAIVGDFTAYSTAFQQAGVIFSKTGLGMIDYAKAFDWQPLPEGNRVGIITNSGGTGVELVDLCYENGLEVPELPPEVQERLKPQMVPFASPKNPVDITPDWKGFKKLYYSVPIEFFECDEIDILIPIVLGRVAMDVEAVKALKRAVIEKQKEEGFRKPVLVCWISLKEHEANMRILEDAGIPCYTSPERAAEVAGAMVRYMNYLREG
jgi:acetyltransferase